MKKILITLCILFIGNFCFADTKTTAVVSHIIDGDTFAAKIFINDTDIQISVRVRIIGMDTPEIKGGCKQEIILANKAKKRLSELLPINSTVYLSKIKDDKYLGRIDAIVKKDNKNIANILIKEGLARKYNGGKRKPWCK